MVAFVSTHMTGNVNSLSKEFLRSVVADGNLKVLDFLKNRVIDFRILIPVEPVDGVHRFLIENGYDWKDALIIVKMAGKSVNVTKSLDEMID